MYQQFFGLRDTPFSIAPNPQFLYMSARHQEALAHLLYGVQSDGGFILLTGEVGTGKTTLCRCLLQQIPQDVETAFVLNPRVTPKQLLASICDEFGITYPQSASLKRLVDNLNDYLLACHAQHKRAVLIIDEAQNLSRDLLEQLRLLTNLETSERKLLQIILLGQPELLDMLAEDNLRQFSQRITARFHLEALAPKETLSYIRHRLDVVGGDPNLFQPAAMRKVHRLSGGIPRVINLICDRSLLGAYASDKRRVDASIVSNAAREVLGDRQRGKRASTLLGLALAASILVAAGSLMSGHWLNGKQPLPDPLTQTGPAEKITMEQAAVPATVPPVPDIRGHVAASDAYHDLFALWGTAFVEKDDPPCELAPSVGLACLQMEASLDQLTRLNRPAVVSLKGQYLTLSAIQGDQVTLFAGASQFDLPREVFNRLYDGSARLLWRAPPAYEAELTISDRGAAVDWLITHLSRIDGTPVASGNESVFDEDLAMRLRNFQAAVGLDPNGTTDPQTWIHLNSWSGITVPLLDNRLYELPEAPQGAPENDRG